MTPAERVARLKQLYEQVTALNAEIAQLEGEDGQFVSFKERSQQARRKLLAYPDFVRYSAYREQLEAAWTAAGRPRSWEQAELLVKLRDVLLISAAESGGAPTPVPPRPVARPPPPQTAPTGGASPPPAPAGSVRAATTSVAPARPGATAPAAPPPRARPGPAASAPTAPAPPAAAPPRPGSRAAAAAGPVSHSQLIEMHAPILNEVGDLTRRAEEEFRMGQTASALVSVERATYLIERVAYAPAAMSQRLLKVLDEGLKEGALADADRARREHVRGRIATVLASEG